jgi:thioredoxin-like negative regulator of GroEL
MRDVSAVELDQLLRDEERLVLVEFWHPRCEPCRELRRALDTLGEEVCATLAVDGDREPGAVVRHGIADFPTLLFFKHGRELYRFKGGALPASTLARLR